jgi:predicted nuclease of restriction endonuclease-like (RecB) superfamily
VPPKRLPPQKSSRPIEGYDLIVSELVDLVESARRFSARSVNAVMTATYWEIGRRIVEVEQRGKKRAEYGEALLKKLASDLTARFGKGFRLANLKSIRKFFLTWPEKQIGQTVSGQSASELTPLSSKKGQTLSDLSRGGQGIARLRQLAVRFPLPWSHYVRLMALSSEEARRFYETEALRCGWSFRQLDRQISSQFYERTALSRNKTTMLKKSSKAETGDLFTPEEEIKDPFVLEFLGLKDEYSESDLEEALILHLEAFLLELGGDFAFVARQRLYLNYAKEHWVHDGENPPVGVILCAQKDEAVAHYALEGLANKVLAREYLTVLPSEKALVQEIEKARREIES